MGIPDYAKHRGVRINAVQYAIKAGRIHLDSDNHIDSEVADREWEANTDAALARPGPKPKTVTVPRATEAVPGMDFASARALEKVFDVKRKELDLEVRSGKLVLREQVEREAFEQYRILRDAMLAVPDRLASRLATMHSREEVFRALDHEIRSVFQRFSEGGLQCQ